MKWLPPNIPVPLCNCGRPVTTYWSEGRCLVSNMCDHCMWSGCVQMLLILVLGAVAGTLLGAAIWR